MIAHSKINLALDVFALRPDGYHELDTLFYPLASPRDVVTLDFSGEGLSVVCSDPGVPADPAKNLCTRAAMRYAEMTGQILPACRVHLEKEIPCAGGMGGGSSDAAAVLLLLEERFHAAKTMERLSEIAFSLGADVPFFLCPKPARARGAGEKLEIADGLPERLPLLVAAPDFPVSAKWTYSRWTPSDALARGTVEQLISALRAGDLRAAAGWIGNSLARPALEKFPLLRMLRRALLETGALAAEISGSGPSLFALYPDFDRARDAEEILRRDFAPAVRFFRG